MKTETTILDTISDLDNEDVKNLRPAILKAVRETINNLAYAKVTNRVLASAIADDVCAALVRNLKGH